jgi:hypothetical protein
MRFAQKSSPLIHLTQLEESEMRRNKVKVSERALLQRINRALTKDGDQMYIWWESNINPDSTK